jgi:hypothetical protein
MTALRLSQGPVSNPRMLGFERIDDFWLNLARRSHLIKVDVLALGMLTSSETSNPSIGDLL